MPTALFLPTADDTHALGVRLGEAASPGTVIALRGDLGAGKTALAQGIGAGLGVRGVRSPTFVILQLHEGGRLQLWHGDWYRLSDPDELEHLGFDDALAAGGVVVVEWAERFPEALPADHLVVELVDQGQGRRASLRATGPAHRHLEVLGG
jgi:tRNA threonylcarbamoyladenosine biosynthesis protein TsaE